VHAERCLTFHNEKPGSVPFAAWIDPSWHNCLVGCLHCQRVCPENRSFWPWVEERAAFSQEETALLLEGTSVEKSPAATVEKMHRLGLDGYYDVLPRNLNALLYQRR
jgi:epoxyqueuosine reductase